MNKLGVFNAVEKHRLVEEYCNASEEGRVQMEQRYGKKQLQALVDTSLSENWLFNNSKNCPKCSAAIEVSCRADLRKFKLWTSIIMFCILVRHTV
jgi:E3 ubiquitin-protein ligase RNF14